MKYIKRYLIASLIIIMSISSTSCSDFLDRKPQGSTYDDGSSETNNVRVNRIYGYARSYNITAGIPAFLIHMVRSEDSEKGSVEKDGKDNADFFDNFEYHANNGAVKAYWDQNYKIIVECNAVIISINEKSEISALSDDDKAYLGEAYFFRAFCFFNMVRAFGEVPKIDFRIVDVEDANIPKSSIEDIYKLIDEDLATIINNELLPTQWGEKQAGRLTFGAAKALQAKTYMQRNDWTNMFNAAETVINLGIYNLQTPYDKLYTEEGEYSSESIFELGATSTPSRPSDNAIGTQFCQVQGVRGTPNLGWGWHMATTELGEAYESGDPRKDATLLYFRRSSEEPITSANSNKPDGESPVSTAMGAYFNKKAYVSPTERGKYSSNAGKWVNIRLIRYADIVLMAAEAANELGKTNTALQYLEQIRERARGGDNSILPKVTTTDKDELREKIHFERRIELALEPDRFYDLVRWGEAEKVLHAAGKTKYQDKHKYLPIPQTILDQSGGVLVQNPNF